MILKGQKDKVERKVTVLKRGDGEAKTKVEFYLICKTAGVQQQVELDAQFKSAAGVSDVDLVRDWTDGWKGLQDADGNDVAYNDENLDLVMDDRDYREAIVAVVFEALFGRKVDFKLKNS